MTQNGIRKPIFPLLCGIAALGLSSCGGPSYPKERIAQSLVELCRKEYGLDVRAQVAGTTLGVLAPIPGLVDEMRKFASEREAVVPAILVEGNYGAKAFDFQILAKGSFTRVEKPRAESDDNPNEKIPEPIEKLRKISTAIMRVALSTDLPLEFYQLIARDPGPDHLDILFSGHLADAKKGQFWAISLTEIRTRSAFSARPQPEMIARAIVAGFLKDLPKVPLPQLLSRYTASSKRFEELLPKILLAVVELKGAQGPVPSAEWPVLQTDRSTALVYAPLGPQAQSGALLFTVEIKDNLAGLLDLDRVEAGTVPPQWKTFGPPETWKDRFYLEPILLPQFLTEQIAKRVAAEFQPLEEKPKDKKAKGHQPQPATTKEVTRVLAETAAYVVHSYEFNEFRKIDVVDALEGTHWVISAADLPLYRRRNPPELKPVP